jgi:putative nucleotidyltransferase with HDIG domain
MRAGNKQIDTKELLQIKGSKSIDQVNDSNQNSILITILPVLSMIVAILPGIMMKASGIHIAKVGILTLILTSASAFYIRLNAENILNKKLAKTIITVSYLASICLLLLVQAPETFSFWMIGGLLVAMLIDSKLGLLLHFNLSFILGITLSSRPEIVIHILIIGVLMNLLAGAIKQKTTVIYAIIIILSTNITLSFAINNFIFDTNVNFNYMNSLFSILAILIITFFIGLIYDKTYSENNIAKEAINNSTQALAVQEMNTAHSGVSQEVSATPSLELELNQEVDPKELETSEILEDYDSNKNLSDWTSYDKLCDDNNELINKMKQFSESLYTHSLHIGDLSCRAAKEIGANDIIAKAGGLYHEIGKINGRNYIEEGLIIAEVYAFPKELKAILKEHNIKYEKPSSVEAAIVMLSDNVVSTIEYIEKTEDNKFTTNKIIDNIFQMRMDKGTFDAANLSLKDFKKLKEFYQKEFSK